MSAAQRGPSVIASAVATSVCLALLIALGVWQLHRKVWKEDLIAAMTARLDRTPQPLPSPPQWSALKQGADEFRHVEFAAEFVPGEQALVYAPGSALRSDIKGPGYFVFAPAKLADGSVIVVDRGFVPLERKDVMAAQAPPQGSVHVVGYLRWPETPGMFTPAADTKGNVWFVRDPGAMAAAHRWGAIAPFYVDQETPVPPGGLPLPGKLVVNLPDNHLQYAITWFGLAAGLAGVYGVWLAGRFRKSA